MICGLAVLTMVLVPQEDKVGALSRELESADVRRIYHAVSDLAALGEPALPAIEGRVRDAKGRARDYLSIAADEIRSARLTTGIPPLQRVSMKASDRNVIELLGDLRARTGVALSLENLMGEEKLPEIPVDIRDATMLEAFDAICHAGNVTVTMENGQFMLYQGEYPEMPRFFYEHYFFRLGNFVLMKTADFRKPAVQSFKIQMEMLWDPAAAPCKFNPPVLVEAADDKGKSLILPPPKEAPKGPREALKPEGKDAPPDAEENGVESISSLQLLPPSPAAEKISLLRGYATIGLPRTKVTLSFAEEPKKERKDAAEKAPDPPADAPSALDGLVRKSGDFSVKIVKVEPALLRVTCEVTSKTMKVEDIGKMPFLSSVTLKGGEPTRSFVNLWSVKEGAAEVMISYSQLHLREALVKPPGDEKSAPATPVEKIELSIVTAMQERKIPFEFRDVKIK